MRQETIEIFGINELSETAKEKAYSEYLSNIDYFWTDEILDSAKAFAALFPVKLTNWQISSYDSDFSFEMTCDSDIQELSGQRLATYIWNNYGREIYKGKYYSTAGRYDENGKYHYKHRYSRIILGNSCVLTGVCFDHDILGPVYEFLRKPDSRDFYDLMRDCFSEMETAARRELESQESFEYFLDHAAANNYEYTADGKRY